MKREILLGNGIQGMRIDLSVADMFVASQVADELKNVLDNHKKIEEYRQCPYDKRKETYPEGEPERVELSKETLENLLSLMNKLSLESKSTLFTEEDDDKQPF